MRFVDSEVQKNRKRIIMSTVKAQDYLDGSFMSLNTRQVPRVL